MTQNILSDCNCKKSDCNNCCQKNKSCSIKNCISSSSSLCKSKCNKPCKKKIVTWRIKYLVANEPSKSAHTDSALGNPCGLVITNNQMWVVNNFTDTLTSYDLHGNRLYAPVVMKNVAEISGSPIGLILNCSGAFPVTSNTQSAPATLISVSEAGTIIGYNPSVSQIKSYVVVNTQVNGKVVVYKDCAIVDTFLYCTDFYNNKVDVFNGDFELQTGFPFIDGDLTDPIPPEFAPHTIVYLGCYIYLTYSKQVPSIPLTVLRGPGLGYVSIFNPDGTFVRRFYSRGVLNDPASIIPAPCECGFPKDSILISNFGDGTINIFDCEGNFCGKLLNAAGLPLVIDGLWSLATYYKCNNEIFFSASPDLNFFNKGLLGSLIIDKVLEL